ncbi:hypothetical protein [Streptomyces sp. NPDC059479]|uniref:hypothetical protein n=1 Tax=Streptomyces sp. NPDC059479 TaxID=3346848 RepID=UPI0036C162AF
MTVELTDELIRLERHAWRSVGLKLSHELSNPHPSNHIRESGVGAGAEAGWRGRDRGNVTRPRLVR